MILPLAPLAPKPTLESISVDHVRPSFRIIFSFSFLDPFVPHLLQFVGRFIIPFGICFHVCCNYLLNMFFHCLFFKLFLILGTLNPPNAAFYICKTNSCQKSPFRKEIEKCMIFGSLLAPFRHLLSSLFNIFLFFLIRLCMPSLIEK